MELGEKVRHLRAVEGIVRGLGRPMTKAEVVRAMREELSRSISQAYLSQIESGARPHLTEATRDLLARFFKVHPGYLVSDPPDWSESALSASLLTGGDRLKIWLLAQAEVMADEPMLAHLLLRLARLDEPRRYLYLIDRLLDLPYEAARQLVDGEAAATGDGPVDRLESQATP